MLPLAKHPLFFFSASTSYTAGRIFPVMYEKRRYACSFVAKVLHLETRVIGGIKYILINAEDDVEVNGVTIRIKDGEALPL